MNSAEKTKKSDRTRNRLIQSAIHAFSTKNFRDVSIAEIAREADMTPQGVYRYFSGKEQLFFASLQSDIDALHHQVIDEMTSAPLASLTGATWHSYAAKAYQHPMAKSLIPMRDSRILNFVADLESTKQFRDMLGRDMIQAQRHGLIRSDIDIYKVQESSQYLMTHLLLPLIFEDKYMGDEWKKISYLLLGLGFYPIPDLSTADKQRAFEKKMAKTIALIAAESDLHP